MKVSDFMREHDNAMVELHKKPSRDPAEPWYDFLWSGDLHSIPQEYQEMEVLLDGYGISAGCHILNVI